MWPYLAQKKRTEKGVYICITHGLISLELVLFRLSFVELQGSVVEYLSFF